MDLNDPKTAQQVIVILDYRVERGLRKYKPSLWCAGKVSEGGNGLTVIPVFINDSTTVTTVRNPNNISVDTGDLVFVWTPNLKLDNMSFVDHKL
jgi:hypothetical protein